MLDVCYTENEMQVAQSCLTPCIPMDCSPWNSPGQNTGVGSLSLLQGIFPTQGLNPGLPHCRPILYQLSHTGTQEYWSGEPIPSPEQLPDPGVTLGSLALQIDSLPTELSGKSEDIAMMQVAGLLTLKTIKDIDRQYM